MAGDWIKMRMDLPEDPAVYRIARLTSLDRLAVVGRLYAFWAWADKHAVDGRVDGGTSEDVDDIVSHVGFAEAMEKVNWLEIGDQFLAIPKHDRHNGESAKERSLKNARQARWREKQDAPPSTTPSTKASTREEKRREEKITSVPKGTGGKPPQMTDPDEIIFGYGLALLTNAGTAEKQARSFLGGLRKHHGDDNLIDKLRECARARPLQPLEWLAAALPPSGASPKPNKQEALEASNAAVAERFLRNGGYAP